MNRKIVAILLIVALLLTVVTGCKKAEKAAPAAAEAAAPAAPEKVVLTVWESAQGPDTFIKKAGEAFTATHPNIEINYVNVELGDACSQIALDGPAGVGADLFAAPHDKLGELVTGGHVLPTVNAAAVKNQILGACATALTYDGVMYGYPVSAETYALFYNKAYISEADLPKTWDDLAAWSAEFNAANPGKYGFVMDVGNGYYTIVFTSADGNRLFGASGTDTSSTYLNNAKAVKGLKFFQSLRKSLDVPAADLGTSMCDAAFAAGTAAMHITGLWNVVPFEEAGIDFGVAPLPALPGDSTPAPSFSGTRAMFVSAYSDHPAEAAEFAQFLLTPEMQALRFDLTGTVPSISVEVSSKYTDGFLQQLDYAFPMPSIPEMGTFWEAMNNASANIWNGADVQAEMDACDATILGK